MKPVIGLLAIVLTSATAACVPPVPPQSVAMATTAPQFVTMATVSNAFEIETSRLALERSQRPAVRRFANSMIGDHTRAAQRLAAVVQQNGMAAPPPALDARHAAMLQSLQAAQGPAFDDAYVTMQAAAHQEAITLFSTYSAQGDNPDLRAFASRTLPTLEAHARMVERLGGGTPSM
jgi:putative membrane protein